MKLTLTTCTRKNIYLFALQTQLVVCEKTAQK